ncbi:unnamed protein product [Prorocentrum cordatum]|uniref:Uncharacterized protein n=1 Tax=Prorocentrum cordatum TaxID=2364126 RepID=A0ABN9R8Y9_9DINO|nr:unnamed protein product [Polarella glacialis]
MSGCGRARGRPHARVRGRMCVCVCVCECVYVCVCGYRSGAPDGHGAPVLPALAPPSAADVVHVLPSAPSRAEYAHLLLRWPSDGVHSGRGTAAMGFQGANNKLVSSSTRNLSEFGILDVPLDEARMSAKRGFASISVEQGSGGLMTEEQAREFQKSLRRR